MSDPFLSKKDFNQVSVVIPTLGGESLVRTIEQLNRGTLIPKEILICIPESDSFKVNNITDQNVKIIRTQCRGQVAQRSIGFQQAQSPFVLQLDDDILVREKCIEQLLTCIIPDEKVAAGPKFFDLATKQYESFLVPTKGKASIFEGIIYWIINGSLGYVPGKISKAGINMGLPETPEIWEDVDWLPGGCLLHRRENLILCDFYPFAGKAHAEDLFHSHLLRKNGIQLVRCGYAKCDVDFSSSSFNGVYNFVKSYIEYSKRVTHLLYENKVSVIRFYSFIVVNMFRLVGRRITRSLIKSRKND